MFRTRALRSFRLALLAGTAVFSIVAPPLAAAADTAGDDAATVEVTGRRQSPAAQAAEQKPQSASVINQQALQDLNAASVRDLAGVAPSISIVRSTITPSTLMAFIRGIGETDPNGESSVGIFIDGIYLPRDVGASQDLLDVQDITIERGPVGFEGGHDAEGGAIRITTTAPSNTPRLTAELGYGSYNEFVTSVAGSGPIISDELFGSLALSHHGRDGYSYNTTTEQNTNNIDQTAVRAKLRATPNDRLEINFIFDALQDQGEAFSTGNVVSSTRTDNANPLVPKNNYFDHGASLAIDYRLSDELQFKSITSIRNVIQHVLYDNTSEPYARASQRYQYHDSSYEQDFRLKGTYDRVDFIAGVYAFHEDWTQERHSLNAGPGSTYLSPPSQILVQPVDANVAEGNTYLAAYEETRLHFTPKLTATFALRANYQYHTNQEELYTLLENPNKTYTTGVANEVAIVENAPRGALIWRTGNIHTDFFKVLPKVALEYAVEPNFRPYVSVSQGQKSGGYDWRSQTPAAQGGLIQASTPFQPEQLTTAEIGLKTKLFDDRLQFNTAAFYNNFTQIQFTVLDPSTGVSRRFNAGNAHSVGLEAEVAGTVLPGWTVHVSATALDAELDSYRGKANPGKTPRPGEQLPYSPRFQGSIGSAYELPIPTPGTWRLFGDAALQTTSYTSAIQQGPTIISGQSLQIPGQVLIDLGASYTSEDGRWSATLTARNITNHLYAQSQTYYSPVLIPTNYNPPATVFLALRYTL